MGGGEEGKRGRRDEGGGKEEEGKEEHEEGGRERSREGGGKEEGWRERERERERESVDGGVKSTDLSAMAHGCIVIVLVEDKDGWTHRQMDRTVWVRMNLG